MTVVLQRVRWAKVMVDQKIVGAIERGAVVLVGVAKGDTMPDVLGSANRTVELRYFDDGHGKMNQSIQEAGGALLVIPNFTLCADLNRGRRPGFDPAAPPDHAKPLYDFFVTTLKGKGVPVESGEFGAHMMVLLENDGPVTFVLKVP